MSGPGHARGRFARPKILVFVPMVGRDQSRHDLADVSISAK